jgi:hypothetical protein
MAIALSAMTSSSLLSQARPEGTAIVDGLMWALENNGANVNWNVANQFCQNFRLGGYADWRLPTLKELAALYDPKSTSEFRIRSPFKLTSCCLWSSTRLSEADDGDARRILQPDQYAFGFYYPNGDRYYSGMNFADGRAQCVRNAK